jgi:protocatechuate 3,4-dioxygenase beta subunit
MPHRQHDHDLGLVADLPRLLHRRRLLGLIAGAGLVTLAGCATNDGTASSAASSSAAVSTSGGSCAEIPEETAGPYPADGSNGPDVLNQSGIVRSDIRSSFGSASGVAEGVPLTIELTVLDASSGCSALAGAAVYLWHCDRDGAYSIYSQSAAGENTYAACRRPTTPAP